MTARCVTADGVGSQSWTIELRHVAEGELSGSGSLEVNHVQGACRSNYTIGASLIE
jgi:hypothetical protein